jgi:hypothetical protein
MVQAPQQVYPLTEGGSYNVIVKVGRAYESRREEEAATLGDLISANPLFFSFFGDVWLRNSDFPGSIEMSERAKAILDPKIQQMLAQKEQGSDIPPAAQAQIMQLQQRVQQAEQVMQAQQQELATRQADNQTKMAIAQLEQDKDIRLQEMRNAATIAVAKINALTKGVISDNEREVEQEALGAEAARTAVEHAHEARLAGHQAGAEHAHDQATQQQDQVHELASMQLDHQHTLEQQQQAADLAPEPAPEGETDSTE